jgi:hypothetical protein
MKLNLKALVIGWFISYVGQMVVNKPILATFALAGMNGSTEPDKLQQVMASLRTSVPLHIIQLITQSIATVVAVYFAVRIAKREPISHSLILGILILVSTTLFALDTLRVWPVWYSTLSLLLPIPTAWLAGRRSAVKLDKAKDAPVSTNSSSIPTP